MKKIIIILISLGAISLSIWGGANLLAKHIYNRKDCERFNIDNIELRTKTNIPEILSSECSCEGNNKVSTFRIDTQKIDLEQYIIDNKFELINNTYSKKGNNLNTKWEANLDYKTGSLIVNIEYKN